MEIEIKLDADNTVFTADTHFGHFNIIQYSIRPFASTGEMDELMFTHLKEADEAGKIIVHLGDFVWNDSFLKKQSWRPKGDHHIFYGNHDKNGYGTGEYVDLYKQWFKHIHSSPFSWRTSYLKVQIGSTPVLLSHEPQKKLHGCHYNLYGHHHNNMMNRPHEFVDDYGWLFGNRKYINVGVDLTDFKPVSFDNAKKLPIPTKELLNEKKVKGAAST